MNIISFCVLGIFTVLASMAIRKYNGEIAALLIISTIVLMCVTALPVLSQLFDTINDLTDSANINNKYISVLIKSIGIR